MKRYWKMKLTCLTPVHIGNGSSYNPSEYIYVPGNRGGDIYFLNEINWLQYLYKKKVIDLFARDLQENINRNSPFSIYIWLVKNEKKLGHIQTVLTELEECAAINTKEPAFLEFNRFTPKKSLNDVHPFIRSGNGNCYIPGSSIKGVLRTALLVQDMMKDPEKYKPFWQKIAGLQPSQGSKSRFIKKELEHIAKDIEIKFAYSPKAVEDAKLNHRPVDIVNDLFKYIQVSDAKAEDPLQMGVVQKVDFGIRAAETGDKPKTMPICRECILPGNALQFSISIDDQAVQPIGIHSMKDILSALERFTELQYGLQADIYSRGAGREMDQLRAANCVLGGGAGYFSKTVLYALAVSQSENFREGRDAGTRVVRAFMQETFSKGRHERDRQLSPHTLKLTRYQNKTALMGLCKVEVEQELC